MNSLWHPDNSNYFSFHSTLKMPEQKLHKIENKKYILTFFFLFSVTFVNQSF